MPIVDKEGNICYNDGKWLRCGDFLMKNSSNETAFKTLNAIMKEEDVIIDVNKLHLDVATFDQIKDFHPLYPLILDKNKRCWYDVGTKLLLVDNNNQIIYHEDGWVASPTYEKIWNTQTNEETDRLLIPFKKVNKSDISNIELWKWFANDKHFYIFTQNNCPIITKLDGSIAYEEDGWQLIDNRIIHIETKEEAFLQMLYTYEKTETIPYPNIRNKIVLDTYVWVSFPNYLPIVDEDNKVCYGDDYWRYTSGSLKLHNTKTNKEAYKLFDEKIAVIVDEINYNVVEDEEDEEEEVNDAIFELVHTRRFKNEPYYSLLEKEKVCWMDKDTKRPLVDEDNNIIYMENGWRRYLHDDKMIYNKGLNKKTNKVLEWKK
jgi:hypothetical protein